MAPIDQAEPGRITLPRSTGTGRLDRWARTLARNERLLWTIAVLALLADVVTTLAGLQVGLAEGNPVIAGALADAGIAGFLGVKVVALFVAAAARLLVPRYRVAIPLGVAVPWLFVATTNTVLLVLIAA